MKSKLDKQEKELLESVENGQWRSIASLAKEKKRYREIARHTLSHQAKATVRGSKKRKTG